MAGPPALSRRVFEKYDKDESGTIDRNEFKAMCYDLGYYLSEAETDIAFRTIDLSGNGDITYDEFYQAQHTPHTPHTRDRTRTHRTRLTMSVYVCVCAATVLAERQAVREPAQEPGRAAAFAGRRGLLPVL